MKRARTNTGDTYQHGRSGSAASLALSLEEEGEHDADLDGGLCSGVGAGGACADPGAGAGEDQDGAAWELWASALFAEATADSAETAFAPGVLSAIPLERVSGTAPQLLPSATPYQLQQQFLLQQQLHQQYQIQQQQQQESQRGQAQNHPMPPSGTGAGAGAGATLFGFVPQQQQNAATPSDWWKLAGISAASSPTPAAHSGGTPAAAPIAVPVPVPVPAPVPSIPAAPSPSSAFSSNAAPAVSRTSQSAGSTATLTTPATTTTTSGSGSEAASPESREVNTILAEIERSSRQPNALSPAETSKQYERILALNSAAAAGAGSGAAPGGMESNGDGSLAGVDTTEDSIMADGPALLASAGLSPPHLSSSHSAVQALSPAEHAQMLLHRNASSPGAAQQAQQVTAPGTGAGAPSILAANRDIAVCFSATPLRCLLDNARRLQIPLRYMADLHADSTVRESWVSWSKGRGASGAASSAIWAGGAGGKGGAVISEADTPPTRSESPSRRRAGSDGAEYVSSSSATSSTFPSSSSASSSRPRVLMSWDAVPPNMHPTTLQLAIDHHPYIDAMFPSPAMRDRFLLQTSTQEIDEDAFCADLLEQVWPALQQQASGAPPNQAKGGAGAGAGAGTRPSRTATAAAAAAAGVRNGDDSATQTHAQQQHAETAAPLPRVEMAWHVWGEDAMDEDNWEFSERFVRMWPSLLDEKSLKRTNWWRTKRGLAPIHLDR